MFYEPKPEIKENGIGITVLEAKLMHVVLFSWRKILDFETVALLLLFGN